MQPASHTRGRVPGCEPEQWKDSWVDEGTLWELRSLRVEKPNDQPDGSVHTRIELADQCANSQNAGIMQPVDGPLYRGQIGGAGSNNGVRVNRVVDVRYLTRLEISSESWDGPGPPKLEEQQT